MVGSLFRRKFAGTSASREGDKITFVLGNEGLVQVRTTRYPTIASVAGAAGELDRPLTGGEMRAAALLL
jgi:hypothetical protein